MSYAVPCSSRFRDAVLEMAADREVNVGDLARSIMLTLSPDAIKGATDPGEPEESDRETVVLKSGPSAGKPWRRKPRLQVRLPAGHDVVDIRKALGIALDLHGGDCEVRLESAAAPEWPEIVHELEEKVARLQVTIATLAFEPLANGVRTQDEAMHVLGFIPGTRPDSKTIKARYRMMAAIHHPDSEFGDHARMSQINQAMSLLKNGLL
ncbi:J domain-containing protein [Hwanghaeella grinnelliae]|uniref:J domain-containing protein n=1 Tax=Hwanghaeella grinnelliae TaxID=2500179 RepID=A0A3S2W5J4_9PROT|nr:J domain-containing protein [Hwanghaeella grinnelliae]